MTGGNKRAEVLREKKVYGTTRLCSCRQTQRVHGARRRANLQGAAVIDVDGALVARYRKVRLFSTVHEDRELAPGESLTLAKVNDFTVGLMICYDIDGPAGAGAVSPHDYLEIPTNLRRLGESARAVGGFVRRARSDAAINGFAIRLNRKYFPGEVRNTRDAQRGEQASRLLDSEAAGLTMSRILLSALRYVDRTAVIYCVPAQHGAACAKRHEVAGRSALSS